MKNLLNAKEVANFLGISQSFAYRLMQRGDIPTIHIGRAVRVREQDLIAFTSQNIQPKIETRIIGQHFHLSQSDE